MEKKKQILELVVVLIGVFLIVMAFIMFLPYVAASNMAIPFKMLYELSPFILMVALAILVPKLNKRPIRASLGLDKGCIGKQFVIGLIIFSITISFIIIPLLFGVDKNNVLSFKARNPIILLYYIVKSIIFVGIGEELVFRGYIYERLKEITASGTSAVIISSIIFGIWHYPIGQNIMQVIMASLLGSLYGFARLKVKNASTLATGIGHGLHDAAINILSYILL